MHDIRGKLGSSLKRQKRLQLTRQEHMLGLRPGSDWNDQIEEAGSLIFHVCGSVQEMLDAGGRPLLPNVSAVEQSGGG
ncbi:uncharacterized protein N7446_008719 [Penicillium canescens]|uniref:uncharacterized protein n=1 Tax=Penicillium canescens TaxID=5083 RepID=UPI0026E0E419|nr:uncharacterized protein N7446_008719 [Penicillium canescens]KAJ6059136.1 hypothetical protein N7446_008719 [Penicillium canescens]